MGMLYKRGLYKLIHLSITAAFLALVVTTGGTWSDGDDDGGGSDGGGCVDEAVDRTSLWGGVGFPAGGGGAWLFCGTRPDLAGGADERVALGLFHPATDLPIPNCT